MPKHKLLQYRQTEQRFVFSNDHVFRSNKTVVKPPLKNSINNFKYSANCAWCVDPTWLAVFTL